MSKYTLQAALLLGLIGFLFCFSATIQEKHPWVIFTFFGLALITFVVDIVLNKRFGK